MSNQTEKLKILYIAGAGRSGSTLLDMLLGQSKDYFATGELRYILDFGVMRNLSCGCGQPFLECPEWHAIMAAVMQGPGLSSPQMLIDQRERYSRTHHVPLMRLPGFASHMRANMKEYLAFLDRLYRAIQQHTSCKVIVDSSKYPGYGFLLSLLPSVDLYVLHLVRDPRAVVFSQIGRNQQSPSRAVGDPPVYSPFISALKWAGLNLGSELLWAKPASRYMRLRYESYVADPASMLQAVAEFVGVESELALVTNDGNIHIEPVHTVSGNPKRMRAGAISLILDRQWETDLRPGSRFQVDLITWPLRLKYGYLGGASRPASR